MSGAVVRAGVPGVDSEDFARMLRSMYAAWNGALFNEPGVHRLVRISPFDEEGRRHTSFAGVEVEGVEVPGGATVRSYVLHPYTMAKDHRLGVEVEDVAAVFAGDLSPFYRGDQPADDWPPKPPRMPPPTQRDLDAAIELGRELARKYGW